MGEPRGHRTLSPAMEKLLDNPRNHHRLLLLMTGETGRRWRRLKYRIRKHREGEA